MDYNTSLNSTFLPTLELVELGFGLDPGSASLGDSIVDIDYDPKILQFEIAYGLTKKVSLGIKLPYWWWKTNAKATG